MSDTIVTVQPQIQTVTTGAQVIQSIASSQAQTIVVDGTVLQTITGDNVTIQTVSVSVPQVVISDHTNIEVVSAGIIGAAGFSGILPINKGGTNAATDVAACYNLINSLGSGALLALDKKSIYVIANLDHASAYGVSGQDLSSALGDYVTSSVLPTEVVKYITRRKAVVTKTSNYTAATTDGTIRADCTSGAVTITLPTAVGKAGTEYVVKKIDSSGNAVTIATTSSQTIDGTTTKALATQYATYAVQSNGTNWDIIGKV